MFNIHRVVSLLYSQTVTSTVKIYLQIVRLTWQDGVAQWSARLTVKPYIVCSNPDYGTDIFFFFTPNFVFNSLIWDININVQTQHSSCICFNCVRILPLSSGFESRRRREIFQLFMVLSKLYVVVFVVFFSFLVSKFNQFYFRGFYFLGQAHNSENHKFCETSRKFEKSANIEAPRTCMYTVNMIVIIFSEKIRSAHRDLNSDPPGPKPCPVTTRPRELLRQERLYLIQFPLVELPFLPTVNTADC